MVGQQEETMRQDDDMTQGFLKYLLLKLLPCLKQLHNEQRDELKVERSLQRTPHVEIEKAAISVDESLHCNNCSTFIVDYHRGCPSCEYQLCLTCCQELRLGCGSGERGGGRREGHQEVVKQQQQDGKEEAELVEIPGSMNLEKPVGESAAASAAAAWAASADGSIRCPPVSRGGCGQCQLSLKTLFEHNWIAKLTMDAEMESYNAQTEQDASRCSICDLCGGDVKKKFLRLAAHRKGENDNYLYCPSRQNIEDVEDKDSGGLAHFQKHWVQGEPIIVCNVLEAGGGHGLSWEPMVVWRAVRETTKKKLERKTVAAIDCLNWQEVDVKLHQFFMGYKKGRSHKDGWPQLLKLKDWPSSIQFEERLPRHTAEFLAALPFQQYTNPKTGFHNLAAQLPENIIKPNLGPKMYIANGLKEELLKGDSVIKLHKDIADIVYVLMHTAEVELLEEQQEVIKKWMQNSKRSSDSKSSFGVKYDIDRPHTRKSIYGGALWDIFRRQDTPKLEAYLRKHWEEFNIPGHWVVESVMHPIHDQAFFLTSDHKRKLKDEYGIEAWTFEQNEGEAVLIPAGCPYQVRNLKSCIHVALEFVSPESLQECLHLTNELRCLPKYHHANEDKLEVKKMLVYGATKVVHSLQQIRDGYD
ncbi:unnamed protein product [Sphagnum jensenii]|uniref:JmjC domain-containing protein n=1 Tax=Sphagnum jensenii TaxID=128206 RepID=A0ABP1B413_9BRYO